MRQRGGVGGKDCGPPATAPLHQPVPQPTKERAGAGQREPLAVRRVGHDQARMLRWPNLLEVPGADRDRVGHPRSIGTRPRRLDRLRVEVAGEEGFGRRRQHPRLELRHELHDERFVAVAKLEEAVRSPARPPEAWRHPRGDGGPFDHERSRPAHRIEQGLARGRSPCVTGPPPAGGRQDARGEHLGQRRLHLAHPPAPLVERAARRVAKHGRHAAHEMQRDPQRRPPQLNVRPLAARRPQLIDHRVLDDLRGVERVREEGVVNRRIDTERVGDLQLLGPIDLLHRPVKRLGRIDGEAAERLEDADGRPRFEHRPVERLAVVPRIRRKLDRPPADPQVAGPDRLEFPSQHPFQALERAGREPRRVVSQRRRQRPRRRRNVRKAVGAHASGRVYFAAGSGSRHRSDIAVGSPCNRCHRHNRHGAGAAAGISVMTRVTRGGDAATHLSTAGTGGCPGRTETSFRKVEQP